MPTPFQDLVVRVRAALSLSEDYDAVILPAAVRAAMRHLLRGYNFSDNVREAVLPLAQNARAVTAPADMKKPELVLFRETDLGTGGYAYKVLDNANGFAFPAADGVPASYWYGYGQLYVDTPSPLTADISLWYQSLDPVANESWLLAKYEDTIFYRTVFAFAAECGKPELAQTFSSLWGEAMTALSIHLNELEFDNIRLQYGGQRGCGHRERYPA